VTEASTWTNKPTYDSLAAVSSINQVVSVCKRLGKYMQSLIFLHCCCFRLSYCFRAGQSYSHAI
jgi:hypothetical protein